TSCERLAPAVGEHEQSAVGAVEVQPEPVLLAPFGSDRLWPPRMRTAYWLATWVDCWGRPAPGSSARWRPDAPRPSWPGPWASPPLPRANTPVRCANQA